MNRPEPITESLQTRCMSSPASRKGTLLHRRLLWMRMIQPQRSQKRGLNVPHVDEPFFVVPDGIRPGGDASRSPGDVSGRDYSADESASGIPTIFFSRPPPKRLEHTLLATAP